MWRITNNSAPSYLTDKVIYAHDVHTYGTSSSTSDKLYEIRGHKQSLFTVGARSWNTLPSQIKEAKEINNFKKLLRNYVLKNIEQF